MNYKLTSLKYITVLFILLALAYKFQFDPIFYYLSIGVVYWNAFVDYVLNFRDKEPYLFMLIPFAIIYCLIPSEKEDA